MKRIAHIDGTTITNVSLAKDDAPLAPNTMLESDALAAGYTYKINNEPPSLPNAENYQIRAWMIRNDLDPDAVPQMITQLVTDAKERKEALMRWDYAVRVPRNFPLVDAIGAQMGLTPEQIDAAWPDICGL